MSDAREQSGVRALWVGLGAVAPVAVAAAFVFGSSRVLVSWHGFVHAAIAGEFPSAALPPENPFFAGEPLPYYWFHQFLAGALGRVLGVDALHALALLTLASAALLMAAALRLGARRFGSAGAGLLVGWLALAGLNPLGPLIAGAKALTRGEPLFDAAPASLETVFVSNAEADRLMTQPLLGALHVSADWRRGQNLPWFLDNSSRGPALALLMPLAALFLARPRGWTLLGCAALGAFSAALNPLVGLAGAGALFGGACTLAVAARVPRLRSTLGAASDAGVIAGAAALFGALLAAPSYLQLLSAASEPAALTTGAALVRKSASIAASSCVLAPLAVYGAWRAPPALRTKLAAIAAGGLALMCAVPVLGLAEGNEHNLANAAGVLLAVPALGFAAVRGGERSGLSRRAALAVFALFVPVTACTLASFAGRPPLPIAAQNGVLVRTPAEHPLAQFYAWVRAETPRSAVFVVDPARPVKMASNVSELPAFTGRALYVDQASYLTTPHAAFAQRTALARALVAGEALTPEARASLARLARPVDLVTHAAGEPGLAARLRAQHGAPVFAAGFVAVFALEGVR